MSYTTDPTKKRPCHHYYCDGNVGCPNHCSGGCQGYKCSKGGGRVSTRGNHRRFDGVIDDAPGFKQPPHRMIANPMGYVVGLVSLGVLVYVVGYAFNKGRKEA